MAQRTDAPRPEHLEATEFVDCEHPEVRRFAEEATEGAADDRERASRLFAAVRDRIRYDPYRFSTDRADYRASAVLGEEAAYCVPKAVLLTAVARAVGVPARVGFADVRNHLQSERLSALMGTDVFVYHGYTELHLGGAWRKATPAFNAELCARFGVAPLEFDGTRDALLHAFSGDGSRHMEYLRDRGVHSDLPFEEVLGGIDAFYPGFRERLSPARGADPAFHGDGDGA